MFYCMCSLYVLGLLSGLFWLFLRQGLPFLVNLGRVSRVAGRVSWGRKAVSFNIAAMMTHVVRGHWGQHVLKTTCVYASELHCVR